MMTRLFACFVVLSGCDAPKVSPPVDAAEHDDPSSVRDARADSEVAAIPACPYTQKERMCRDGWCRIGAGSFTMGSPATEFGRGGNNEELFPATLTRCFIIQQHELTQAQWVSLGFENRAGVWIHDGGINGIGDCSDPNCPASNMTWFEGAEFANALSQKAGLPPCYVLTSCRDETRLLGGVNSVMRVCDRVTPSAPTVYDCRGYRYPTDAEWEYSARAGTTTAFYSGDIKTHTNTTDCIQDDNLASIGWYCWNSPSKLTHPVQQKKPNAWGLYDMLGNAQEFVGDPFVGRYTRPSTDPWQAFNEGEENSPVMRGGVVYKPHTLCRSAWRSSPSRSYRAFTLGLRLVRTLTPGELENWTTPNLPEPPPEK